jgi:peptidoglycan/xylan/chitin deacetylase (PgdA/CDA1 family)
MKDQHTAVSRNTSLPLILLALIVGIALGWLLRDIARTPVNQAPPAAGTLPPIATAAATAGAAPTALPNSSAETTPPTLQPPSPAPTAPPTPPAPTAAPTAAAILGYAGHIVANDESLAAIAKRGGSTPDLVARYNLLDGEPQPGRMLIVPQLEGTTSTLESAPLLVQRGSTDKPWVALTLDAGADSAPVPAILRTLREHNVKITFFLTGKWMQDNPELTRQIVADGHEVANHTFTHPDLRNLSDAAIHKELEDTEATIEQIAGTSTRPFFRPPYGAYDERVLRLVVDEGYLPIYWTFDSLDSVGDPKTPEFLFDRITSHLPPDKLRGAIILAHCGSQPTADALPKILDRFAEMGFEVKKLSEVLGA